MGLIIYWTDFAKKELRKIFSYYKKNINSSVAKSIVLGITKEVLILKKQPKIGQKEELLQNRKQ